MLIARLVSNSIRRKVFPNEKIALLEKLGKIYLDEGVEKGKIAYKIAGDVGMSYNWVIKYLPTKFKDKLQSTRRTSSVTYRVTGFLSELLKPPKRVGELQIKTFSNTNFVSLILSKDFFNTFERNSKEVGMETELSILRALEDRNEKMKKVLFLNKNSSSNDGEDSILLNKSEVQK